MVMHLQLAGYSIHPRGRMSRSVLKKTLKSLSAVIVGSGSPSPNNGGPIRTIKAHVHTVLPLEDLDVSKHVQQSWDEIRNKSNFGQRNESVVNYS